jgi:hypothetical protein
MCADSVQKFISADSAPAISSLHAPPPSAPPYSAQPNATGCDIEATSLPLPPHPPSEYPPTPNIPLPGGPILANQETPQVPYRPDSQLAAPPLDIPTLTNQQLIAIDLYVAGRTDTYIASQLHVHRGTLWRWRAFHPLFKAELARRRQEMWGAAGDRFRRTLFAAIKTLRRQLEDSHAMTSFRAARCLLQMAASDGFAPPPDSTDPQTYLDTFALARRKEIHEPDFMKDPATDSERRSALATLLAKSEPSTLSPICDPPPSSPPTPLPQNAYTLLETDNSLPAHRQDEEDGQKTGQSI